MDRELDARDTEVQFLITFYSTNAFSLPPCSIVSRSTTPPLPLMPGGGACEYCCDSRLFIPISTNVSFFAFLCFSVKPLLRKVDRFSKLTSKKPFAGL